MHFSVASIKREIISKPQYGATVNTLAVHSMPNVTSLSNETGHDMSSHDQFIPCYSWILCSSAGSVNGSCWHSVSCFYQYKVSILNWWNVDLNQNKLIKTKMPNINVYVSMKGILCGVECYCLTQMFTRLFAQMTCRGRCVRRSNCSVSWVTWRGNRRPQWRPSARRSRPSRK